jgi:hypothetical protein
MSIGGAVTGGTDMSVLFVHPAGTLAQDNPHFTFDPVNNYLSVGTTGDFGRYYLNGVPGLYVIANASGNNWFEGNSGNATVTGSSNFGTGDTVLVNLTSGSDNVAIGGNSGGSATAQNITTGQKNVAMGSAALWLCTTGNSNFAFGYQALMRTTADSGNTAVGTNTLSTLGIGGAGGGGNNNNLAFGNNCLNLLQIGSACIGIGASAGANMVNSASGDIFIGSSTGANIVSTGDYNLMIGTGAGFHYTGGSRNTIIGRWLGPSGGGTVNDKLAIAKGDNQLLIDYNVISSGIFSFQEKTSSVGLRVYNTLDSFDAPGNWECGCLDWKLTSNVFRIATQAGGTGTVRLIAIDAFSKAGAPAAGDLPAGTCAFIDDTTNNQTWLVFNKAGTIRKVQLT